MTYTLDTARGRLLAGRYELGEVVGAGGAAHVFRATDRHLDRVVAVKVLDDAAARSADPAARERFLLEARTAAGVDHPNVVTVFDAGTDGGALFLVMELVSGCTLAEHIAHHAPMASDDVLAIGRQIARALAAAHERGIVHRDVKPANVLIESAGRVLLTDFGIAKHLDEIESALTSHGTVVGTPAYLAPEQGMGHPATPASDVYALGVVLHEMLTGWHPPRDTAAAWRLAPFDPRAHQPGVPEPLAAAIMQATDPDPEARFASAGALLDRLDGTAPHAPPPVVESAAVRQPTATMAITPAERPTMVLAEGAGDATAARARGTRRPTRIPGPILAVVALVVGVLIVAGGLATDGIELPATTVPTTPPTTVPVAPSTTAAPAPTAPAAPAPAAPPDEGDGGGGNGNGGNGNGNGNGGNGNNGNGNGKKDG